MKKILLLGLFLLSAAGYARNWTVNVGSGTTTTTHLPFVTNWKYGYSEQIYTPAEVGEAGWITSISFYMEKGQTQKRLIEVYLNHVSKSSYSSLGDFVGVLPGVDRVFVDSVEFKAGGWITIPLQQNFRYNGGDNLLVAVNDKTGSFLQNGSYAASPIEFRTFETDTQQSIYIYNDNEAYATENMSSSTAKGRDKAKNQIKLEMVDQLTTIDRVEIDGFTAPVYGAPVIEEVTVPDDAPYTVFSQWVYDNEDGYSVRVINEENEFSHEGRQYYMLFGVTCKVGYKFAEDVEVSINGGEYWYRGISSNEDFLYGKTKIFTLKPVGTIDRVEINNHIEACIGEHPDYNLTVPDGAHYSIAENYWMEMADFESGWQKMDDDETFNSGCPYYRYISLQANVGYKFASEVTVLVNGSSDMLETTPFIADRKLDIMMQVKYAKDPSSSSPGEIQIGSGDEKGVLPINTYYGYSLSQQIYTAAEIGQAGNIQSISFYNNNQTQGYTRSLNIYKYTRSLDIYMAHTSKERFSGSTDWQNMAEADKVYSGTVTFTPDGWTKITLSKSFQYDGRQNVILCVADVTGRYFSGKEMEFSTFQSSSTTDQVLFAQTDESAYNLSACQGNISGTLLSTKNQIKLEMGGGTPGPAQSNVVDFETGDFSQFTFTNQDENPWTVTRTGDAASTPGYCMMSGNQGKANTSSTISATYTYEQKGVIYFEAKCMGEGTSRAWDQCMFYIDGIRQFSYGARGNVWHTFVFTVPAGTHTFKWEYTKDSTTDSDGDAFFVDNIMFLQEGRDNDLITGIQEIKSEGLSTKDEQAGAVFNLAGQRLQKAQRGINILAGKKILVK